MVTAKDIDTKRFEQAKPGYRPDEVDDFLRDVSASFKKLERDKEEIEQKMNVLVEAVKKYKQEEEDLKNAMIMAQKQSREVVAEAHHKAEQIIAEANIKSDEIVSSTGARLKNNQAALESLKKEVSDFRTNLLNLYRDHLNLINNIPEFDEEEEEEEAPEESGSISLIKDTAE